MHIVLDETTAIHQNHPLDKWPLKRFYPNPPAYSPIPTHQTSHTHIVIFILCPPVHLHRTQTNTPCAYLFAVGAASATESILIVVVFISLSPVGRSDPYVRIDLNTINDDINIDSVLTKTKKKVCNNNSCVCGVYCCCFFLASLFVWSGAWPLAPAHSCCVYECLSSTWFKLIFPFISALLGDRRAYL